MYHCFDFDSKAKASAFAHDLTAEKIDNSVIYCGVKYGREIWAVEWWGGYPASFRKSLAKVARPESRWPESR